MLGRAPGFQGRYRAVLTPVHRLTPLRNDTSLLFVQTFRETRDRRVTKWLAGARTPDKAAEKVVWVQTTNKAVLTAAVEAGVTNLLFDESAKQLALEWSQLARFTAVLAADGALLRADVQQPGKEHARIGRLLHIASGEDLQALQAATLPQGFTVIDMEGWHIIPAENLIAAFQGSEGTLLPVARSAEDAKVMLEALEAGTDGVVLDTDDPSQVRALMEWVQQKASSGTERLRYEIGTVKRVEPAGMGDRVCVDTASLLVLGEGLLVGSFARALFLVHSECSESAYINSRPFRVNAGPVHAYVGAAGGRTAYLAELKSGSQVLVADALGRQRSATVGRVKVERRPLVLVEAETPDGEAHSLLLQNAETVRLIAPSAHQSGALKAGADKRLTNEDFDRARQKHGEQAEWRAISVSELKPGQQVYVLRQAAARHTGISIDEFIREQ